MHQATTSVRQILTLICLGRADLDNFSLCWAVCVYIIFDHALFYFILLTLPPLFANVHSEFKTAHQLRFTAARKARLLLFIVISSLFHLPTQSINFSSS